jgi:hypothetical protein
MVLHLLLIDPVFGRGFFQSKKRKKLGELSLPI